jgi:DNA-binding PadR family transcriptional regulator
MERTLLTDFELMVLLAVLRLEDAYGVTISRELADIAGREVKLAAIYAVLERLESRGLVESRWGEPTAERGGRAKKHVRVTAQGVRSIKATQRALVALWSGIPALHGQKG